mmetsp:Transcript_73840/g.228958  ORF Transcript_73840/g.228958 Transcript_73840/m.228958 type:complete len:276 (+) Transcript_73840:1-828(+)
MRYPNAPCSLCRSSPSRDGSAATPGARGRGRGLLRLAALCGLSAGLGWAPAGGAPGFAMPAAQRRQSSRTPGTAATTAVKEGGGADSGRIVHVAIDRVQGSRLPGASVDSMDSLMREEAVEVLAAGAERAEKVPGSSSLWHAYMKPTMMGPFKNQVRLTCELRSEPSGAIHVDIVAFDVGTADDKGELVFKSYEEDTLSLRWENSITWRPRAGGVQVQHSSSGRMRMALPWWFPLPDPFVKATASAGVQLMLKDGQSKVAAIIAKRHAERARAAR